MASAHAYRQLTLVLSALVFVVNLATACFTSSLPDDPHHIAPRMALYSYFACGAGILGFIGAKAHNANLVTIFANYFCIDVIISTVSRLLVVSILPDVRDAICSDETVNEWLYTQAHLLSTQSPKQADWETLRGCRTTVGIVQGVLVLVAVGWTGVQILLALRVGAFACILRQEERESKPESPAKDMDLKSLHWTGQDAKDKIAV